MGLSRFIFRYLLLSTTEAMKDHVELYCMCWTGLELVSIVVMPWV